MGKFDVLKYYEKIADIKLDSVDGYIIVNPYNGENKDNVKKIVRIFYDKFYSDNKKRRLILGSNPAKRGTSVIGVPFLDAKHLKSIIGITIDGFNINKNANDFLYEVIDKYGGIDKFYSDFYMNFVFPLGIVKINSIGKVVNCNYYENKKLQNELYKYIVYSIKEILNFNIDTSICYCIGSGDNYKFLLELNNKFNFFEKIIPLEHPRFIMQYNSKNKELYLKKYLAALNIKK